MNPGEKKNFKKLADYFDAGDFSEESAAAQHAEKTSSQTSSTEPMDSFTVRLPVSVLEAVRSIAAEENETTGSIIRKMVEVAIAERTNDDATIPVSALKELISQAEDPVQSEELPSRRKVRQSRRERRLTGTSTSTAKVYRAKKAAKKYRQRT